MTPPCPPGTWHAYSRLRTGEVKKQESKEVRVDWVSAWKAAKIQICAFARNWAVLLVHVWCWRCWSGMIMMYSILDYSGEMCDSCWPMMPTILSHPFSIVEMSWMSPRNDQGCVPLFHHATMGSQRDRRCSWFARWRQLPTSQSSNIWRNNVAPWTWSPSIQDSIATKRITHELAKSIMLFGDFFICCSQEVTWTPDRSAQSCLDLIQSRPSCSPQDAHNYVWTKMQRWGEKFFNEFPKNQQKGKFRLFEVSSTHWKGISFQRVLRTGLDGVEWTNEPKCLQTMTICHHAWCGGLVPL